MYLLVDCRFYYGRTQVPIHARSHTNGHVVNSRTNTWPTNSMAWMAANGTRMHIRNLMVSGGHWAHIYIYITIRYTYIIHIQCLLSAWVKSLSAWIRGRTFCMHVLTLNSMPSYIIRLIICCCCSIFCFFFSPDISKIQTFVGKLKSTRESSKVYSMLTDLYSACMNLESLDKSQSDSELRKAIIYLCEYSNSCYFLFFFLLNSVACSVYLRQRRSDIPFVYHFVSPSINVYWQLVRKCENRQHRYLDAFILLNPCNQN